MSSEGSPVKIRAAVPDDAPAVVALRVMVYPYLVRGVESTRRMITVPPRRCSRSTPASATGPSASSGRV
jgi:hypothetical protein